MPRRHAWSWDACSVSSQPLARAQNRNRSANGCQAVVPSKRSTWNHCLCGRGRPLFRDDSLFPLPPTVSSRSLLEPDRLRLYFVCFLARSCLAPLGRPELSRHFTFRSTSPRGRDPSLCERLVSRLAFDFRSCSRLRRHFSREDARCFSFSVSEPDVLHVFRPHTALWDHSRASSWTREPRSASIFDLRWSFREPLGERDSALLDLSLSRRRRRYGDLCLFL